ncbi:MAG: cobyrinate a,c-diamide synthase [Coriobacteriales bacterium]|jgi:cobyrinic acid a,c-diamide synthase
MRASIPRFMIAAPSSGAGKTTVVVGLLRCLARRGLDVRAFKCGPDYIDSMFHETVLGIPCGNLDLFLSTPDEARALLAERVAGADLALVEGVMGFYDGIGGTSDEASSYAVATATDTPVVLVVDGSGVSLTLAAVVGGIREFRADSHIAGVIVNKCRKGVFDMLAPVIEAECGVPALGYVERDDAIALESRHLGLVTAAEVEDLQERVDALADALERTVDVDALLALAGTAPDVECEPAAVAPACEPDGCTIAVARDEAFCFYYDESLEHLRRLGARLAFFSPLRDEALPADADALYLGGGYPELHAAELAANEPMLVAARAAHAAGMPVFAECGGFLYLKEWLEDVEGTRWPMAGILAGGSRYTGKLSRFGYIEMTARNGGMGIAAGDALRAHEFHYYDSDDNGSAFRAEKPRSARAWDCMVVQPRLVAGFPHLYLPSCPDFARGFVEAALAYRGERRA